MKRQPARPEIEPASELIRIVRTLFAELHGKTGEHRRVTLDSSLDRDLGFDSLARMELLSRVQRDSYSRTG